MADSVSAESSGAAPLSNPEFPFSTRLGIVFIVQAAFVSLISVLGLLTYLLYSASKLRRDARKRWDFATPLHWYFFSMLISEVIQATGAIMDLKWVIKAGVEDGPYCAAQGILKQIGDVSVALATLAIAIHTFGAIVFRWAPENPQLTAALVLGSLWLTIILILTITVGTHKGLVEQYWGDTTYWCWITPRYPVQQIVLDYVFMWTTAFVNIILYIPLALVIKGIVTVNGRTISVTKKEERMENASRITEPRRGIDGIAMQMLFYPLLYTITVLPIAIVRFRAFHDQHVPFAATVISDSLFSFSGLFNVVLFALTRPSLLPRRGSHSTSEHAISFSMRSRATANEQEQTIHAHRVSIGRTRMGILPDDTTDWHCDDSWEPQTLDISKGRLSPSFASHHSTA